MTMEIAKRRLAIMWFPMCGVLYLLVLIQTFLGHYGALQSDAWSWLLTNTMPTLLLMVGVFVAESQRQQTSVKITSPIMFQLSFWLSGSYLGVLLLVVLLSPIRTLVQPLSSTSPIQFMKDGQQLWLAPLQGLVSASLGAFFVKADRT